MGGGTLERRRLVGSAVCCEMAAKGRLILEGLNMCLCKGWGEADLGGFWRCGA